MNDQVVIAVQRRRRRPNGFAVASLVTSILPTVILGLGFGLLGIRRARQGSRGMLLSLAGITISLLWIAPIVIVTPHVMKSMDPGCRAANRIENDYPQSRLAIDFNDPTVFQADNNAIIKGLTAAAAESKSAAASKYMLAEANDVAFVQQAAALKQVMGAGIVEQTDNDQDALHQACGAF